MKINKLQFLDKKHKELIGLCFSSYEKKDIFNKEFYTILKTLCKKKEISSFKLKLIGIKDNDINFTVETIQCNSIKIEKQDNKEIVYFKNNETILSYETKNIFVISL